VDHDRHRPRASHPMRRGGPVKTIISHDPFARCETVRRVVKTNVECASCTRRARFQYGLLADGIRTRVSWSPVLVCGLACLRGTE